MKIILSSFVTVTIRLANNPETASLALSKCSNNPSPPAPECNIHLLNYEMLNYDYQLDANFVCCVMLSRYCTVS